MLESDTLIQESPNGNHALYQYDEELKTGSNLGSIKEGAIISDGTYIDIRNDGAAIVIQPSKRDGVEYKWVDFTKEIKSIPKDLKDIIVKLQVESSYKTWKGDINNSEKDEPNLNSFDANQEEISYLEEGDGRNSRFKPIS